MACSVASHCQPALLPNGLSISLSRRAPPAREAAVEGVEVADLGQLEISKQSLLLRQNAWGGREQFVLPDCRYLPQGLPRGEAPPWGRGAGRAAERVLVVVTSLERRDTN